MIVEWNEHSPGSFVVSLAPISALLDAPRRKRDQQDSPLTSTPASLDGLERSTLELLRKLAQRSLEALGAHVPQKFIEAEMLSQFNTLAPGVQAGADGERRLREAIVSALEQLDDE